MCTLFKYGIIKGEEKSKMGMHVLYERESQMASIGLFNRRLTAKTVGNSHRKPRILATGRYCDETMDGAEL